MKKIVLAIAALTAFGTAATAMTLPGLSTTETNEVRAIQPDADLSNLSAADIAAIQSALYGEDNEKGPMIRAILN